MQTAVYSVYEAGRWFTDESYIYSSRVDYLQDLRNKINDSSGFEKKAMYESQRICCYINKEIAEQEAERLHRQFIQKICLAVDDFNWKQENPDFKIKKWCIKNNINYSSKWNSLSSTQIEWEIQKISRNSKYRDIINKFNRHKYITIETWCHDNHVDFERSVDTFENYQNLLEYLDLPENIDLLSKFYKDGIAHFAFMKEEIVQKQVYLKTDEKLINRNGQNISIKLAARPENYDRQASNYLINILNNVHSQPKKRFKAYELLKEFNTPEATAAIARGIEDIEVKSIFDLGDEIELNSIRHSWDGNPT